MSWTRADYDALCQGIAKGVTTLKLGNGEEVTYRSLDEMLRLKRLMADDLGIVAPQRGISAPGFTRGGR